MSEKKPDAAKTVKIKLLRDLYIDGQVQPSGTVHMVTPEEAVEFCDKKFAGMLPFYGTKPEIGMLAGGVDPLARQVIVRAERVS